MTTALPKISLVTCSYQQGRFLGSTIRSVLDQAYPALEYLVVDGGSTDGSIDVIRRHEASLAYWVSEPDRGQTDALIKGFSRSSGEVQGWLCSDDLLLPRALETVGRFFRDNPQVSAMYGDALWIDAEGRFVRPKREMRFSRFIFHYDHNYVPQPSMFWRRSLYDSVGGLNVDFNLAMDSDLWDRFAQSVNVRHIPAYLSCMRFYPEQKTRRLKPKGRREDSMLRARYSSGSVLSAIPYGPLHLLARLLRVSLKALAGGYGASVPHSLLESLNRYQP